MSLKEISDLWNDNAETFNQWNDLTPDEHIAFAQVVALRQAAALFETCSETALTGEAVSSKLAEIAMALLEGSSKNKTVTRHRHR